MLSISSVSTIFLAFSLFSSVSDILMTYIRFLRRNIFWCYRRALWITRRAHPEQLRTSGIQCHSVHIREFI